MHPTCWARQAPSKSAEAVLLSPCMLAAACAGAHRAGSQGLSLARSPRPPTPCSKISSSQKTVPTSVEFVVRAGGGLRGTPVVAACSSEGAARRVPLRLPTRGTTPSAGTAVLPAGHCGPGEGRQQGRGAGQPVSGQHPRVRLYRPGGRSRRMRRWPALAAACRAGGPSQNGTCAMRSCLVGRLARARFHGRHASARSPRRPLHARTPSVLLRRPAVHCLQAGRGCMLRMLRLYKPCAIAGAASKILQALEALPPSTAPSLGWRLPCPCRHHPEPPGPAAGGALL